MLRRFIGFILVSYPLAGEQIHEARLKTEQAFVRLMDNLGHELFERASDIFRSQHGSYVSRYSDRQSKTYTSDFIKAMNLAIAKMGIGRAVTMDIHSIVDLSSRDFRLYYAPTVSRFDEAQSFNQVFSTLILTKLDALGRQFGVTSADSIIRSNEAVLQKLMSKLHEMRYYKGFEVLLYVVKGSGRLVWIDSHSRDLHLRSSHGLFDRLLLRVLPKTSGNGYIWSYTMDSSSGFEGSLILMESLLKSFREKPVSEERVVSTAMCWEGRMALSSSMSAL